ncbi:MAG: maleylpyruvate isomerase N-terminal domain-containing protein [Acidobacteriota bacterium]
MHALQPIDVRPLFHPLHHSLIDLLRGLDPADWTRPTVAGSWRVRDVVAHLLDVQLRDVAALRDDHQPPLDGPIDGYESLVDALDRLNARWISAAERLSPQLLIELLDHAGTQAAAILLEQPMEGTATFAVDWAGTDASQQWMHAGRQYTEYWHHHMQIRDAVDAPRLLEARWLAPLLDLSVRALPRTYADVDAPIGTTLALTIDRASEAERNAIGPWTLARVADGWSLRGGAPDAPTTTVRLQADESWRLFYNARAPATARARAATTGDARWAEPLWRARAAMVRAPDDA